MEVPGSTARRPFAGIAAVGCRRGGKSGAWIRSEKKSCRVSCSAWWMWMGVIVRRDPVRLALWWLLPSCAGAALGRSRVGLEELWKAEPRLWHRAQVRPGGDWILAASSTFTSLGQLSHLLRFLAPTPRVVREGEACVLRLLPAERAMNLDQRSTTTCR
jgi:hypothetical protein